VAGEVTARLAVSNGSLPLGGWLTVTCGLTACTPGSAPGPTLGIEYGKPLPCTFYCLLRVIVGNEGTSPTSTSGDWHLEASQTWCVPSMRKQLVDRERIRPVGEFPLLAFLL